MKTRPNGGNKMSMTIIQSEKKLSGSPASGLFALLSDFNHFSTALPEQVTNFRSDSNSCSFTIKGMADVSLIMSEKSPYRKVVYANANEKPFPFQLIFDLDEKDSDSCTLQVSFEGDLNPMLSMMAKGPLQHFVNSVADKIASLKKP